MSKIYIKATMFEQINVCANFGLNRFLPSPQETNVSNVTKRFEIQLSTLKVISNVGLYQMFESINQIYASTIEQIQQWNEQDASKSFL